MQSITRIASGLAHFVWKKLLLEGALLILVAIAWHWTDWHTTATYGDAVFTTGGIIAGLGLLALTTRGGPDDMKLSDAEMEMRSWDHKSPGWFTFPYSESTRAWVILISLGIVTAGIGMVLNIYIP